MLQQVALWTTTRQTPALPTIDKDNASLQANSLPPFPSEERVILPSCPQTVQNNEMGTSTFRPPTFSSILKYTDIIPYTTFAFPNTYGFIRTPSFVRWSNASTIQQSRKTLIRDTILNVLLLEESLMSDPPQVNVQPVTVVEAIQLTISLPDEIDSKLTTFDTFIFSFLKTTWYILIIRLYLI